MVVVRALSPALAEKARAELGESAEALAAGVRQLRDWARGQPHLRARTDDQWLATFLRGCKYRLDQTKAKIDLYYSLRNMAPELHSLKYNDPKVGEILDRGAIVTLPIPRTSLERVKIMRVGALDPKEHTVFDMVSVQQFLNQIHFMEDDNFTVAGEVNIIDLRNTRLGHYTQTSPRHVRNIIYTNQDAMPVRIKEAHIIGAPKIFIIMMNFIKRFLSDKLKNRMFMHADLESLYEYVPRDLLPAEYGGTASTIREINDHWKRKMVEYYEFYEDDLKYGTDETLRVKEQRGRASLNID